jgi:hypothetical protein
MTQVFVYIDQNILGYAKDGRLFVDTDDLRLVFSETHFKEFPPGQEQGFLDTIDALHARMVKIRLDQKFEITDSAEILPETPVRILYDRFKQTYREDLATAFDPMLSRLYGGEDLNAALKVPDDLRERVTRLLEANPLLATLAPKVEQVFGQLKEVLSRELPKAQQIEIQRKQMGTDKGRLSGIPPSDVLPFVNDILLKNTGVDYLVLFEKLLKGKPNFLRIAALNSWLNSVGYNPDTRLSSRGKVANSRNDAEHMGNAAFCQLLLTEDRRLAKRATAIYQYLRIKTQVVQITMKS